MYKHENIIRKLLRIADMEIKHAKFWASFLLKRGIDISNIKITRFKILLRTIFYRLIGMELTLKLLELGEREAVKVYALLIENKELSDDEREELRSIIEDELLHEDELVEEESMFKDFLEHIRDAVLGLSDGLVEILSVAAGLAGAYNNPLSVALGGTIVGIAGALSMGIGSYTSVRTQRQVRMSLLGGIRLASKYVGHLLREKIEKLMRSKGFSNELSRRIASEASNNRNLLTKIIAEEKYGLKEEKLEDPRKAGLYTGVFYLVGAITPLIPYYLGLPITMSLPLSFLIAIIILMVTGFIIAVIAGLSIKRKVLELVVTGLGSATFTYMVGRLASLVLGIDIE